jgi:hypothetical protein
MKLKTHDIFSAGVLTALGLILTNPVNSLTTACILSFVGNGAIDKFGHKKNGAGIPIRTYKTHSFIRSVIYGFLPALFVFLAAKYLYLNGFVNLPANIDWILLQGIFIGPLHLAIDIITEDGIFVKKNGRFQRFALAHIKYDSFLWNSVFKIVGLFIIFFIFRGFFRGFYE